MTRLDRASESGTRFRESGERLQDVETRCLKVSEHGRHGISHAPTVRGAPTEMEGAAPPPPTATDGNSVGESLPSLNLVAAVSMALGRCGISDKCAALTMGLTPGQWSKQKHGQDGHHIQLDRLARLPDVFQVEFSRLYAEMVGVTVAHESIADLLVARVGQLLQECSTLAAQLRALRRIA